MAGNLGKAVGTLVTVMTDDEDASGSDEDLKHWLISHTSSSLISWSIYMCHTKTNEQYWNMMWVLC